MKALIIDDQATARTLLRCILESYGDVEESAAGQDGLTRFHEAISCNSRYDLVCIDLGLPDIDGMKVLEGIRSCESAQGLSRGNGAATVFMITASDDPMKVAEAEQHQADAFLQKPVSYSNLLEAFEHAGLEPTG